MNALPLDAVAALFQQLSVEDLEALDAYYRDDVHYRDPLHEFASRELVQELYARMFQRLEAPRYVIEERFGDRAQGVLVWRFYCTRQNQPLSLRGTTHLRFAADGRIAYQRDYWDAGSHIYERLPVLGPLLTRIKPRLRIVE